MTNSHDALSAMKELAERVAALERRTGGGETASAERPLFCGVPATPPPEMEPGISAHRARLVQYAGAKWVNETVLHYYFFRNPRWGAGAAQMDMVRAGFERWRDVGIGVTFEEVQDPEAAEIRIGFQLGDGYWSGIGTHILRIGLHERTMNFGQDLTRDRRGVDVPVHEIGHTLGFPHEHQNPIAGIVWDEQAVIDYFSGPPNNWGLGDIRSNVLDKIPRSMVDGSDWDPDSIMHYAFEPGLIRSPAQYQHQALRPAAGLSELDRAQALHFYPAPRPSVPTLTPFESVRLELGPGEQRNFRIAPAVSRRYTLQTFGLSDSVIVLFERVGDRYVYLAGDDDSGWNRNARLSERLLAGREYMLRVRMYYQWGSGSMAVMLS